MSSAKSFNLEKSLAELEELVEELESGDLPLEKAMKKFEAGIQLRSCSEAPAATNSRTLQPTTTDALPSCSLGHESWQRYDDRGRIHSFSVATVTSTAPAMLKLTVKSMGRQHTWQSST